MTDDDEVNITPEMIEAGTDSLRFFDYRVDSAQEMAAEIFRAMERARRDGPTPRHPLGKVASINDWRELVRVDFD